MDFDLFLNLQYFVYQLPRYSDKKIYQVSVMIFYRIVVTTMDCTGKFISMKCHSQLESWLIWWTSTKDAHDEAYSHIELNNFLRKVTENLSVFRNLSQIMAKTIEEIVLPTWGKADKTPFWRRNSKRYVWLFGIFLKENLLTSWISKPRTPVKYSGCCVATT